MNNSQKPFSPFRSIGFWLVLLLAVAQLSNAFRVALDAPAFGNYMGLPLHDAADASWVQVYGFRTVFIGLFASFLIWTRQYRVLSSMALIAVVMPLGDFWLVWQQQEGSAATLARHALLSVLLVAAWFFLARTARSADRTPA